MKIVYEKPTDAILFDIERYYKSLNRYGEVSKEAIEKGRVKANVYMIERE